MFSQNPEDKNEYYMSKGKGNLIPREVKGLKYTTTGVPMTFSNGKEGTMFKVDWLGDHDMNADEVSRMEKDVDKNGGGGSLGGPDSKVGKAKLMLLAELASGPRLATEMYAKGKDELGADKNVMKDAKWALGIICSPPPGPFYWSLPGGTVSPRKEPTPPGPSDVL
jgi:hypothetical protein